MSQAESRGYLSAKWKVNGSSNYCNTAVTALFVIKEKVQCYKCDCRNKLDCPIFSFSLSKTESLRNLIMTHSRFMNSHEFDSLNYSVK